MNTQLHDRNLALLRQIGATGMIPVRYAVEVRRGHSGRRPDWTEFECLSAARTEALLQLNRIQRETPHRPFRIRILDMDAVDPDAAPIAVMPFD